MENVAPKKEAAGVCLWVEGIFFVSIHVQSFCHLNLAV
jgi:hypothetical protein